MTDNAKRMTDDGWRMTDQKFPFVLLFRSLFRPSSSVIRHPSSLFLATFALFVTANAWMSEDAYITLRVLDNFFNGYGLRWNINERVQVYTHPLWLLLHIPVNLIVNNLFLTNVLLSVACTTAAIWVTLKTAPKSVFFTLTCFFLPLIASKAFCDYTASGLENPLSYLLFTAFGTLVLKHEDHPEFWLYCSLLTALSMVNRLDMIIFYAPLLLWLVCTRFADIRWKQVALGALPLVMWLSFSLFYYGFLFPNTKYAKLGTGLSMFRYIHHGINYARFTFITDTATGLEILSSLGFIVLALLPSPACGRGRGNDFSIAIALGQCWYVLYLIGIGGDYMVGRFWAYPAFIGVWLFYTFIPDTIDKAYVLLLVVILGMIGTPLPTSAWLRKQCPPCNINPHPMIDAKYMFGGNLFVPKLSPITVNTEAHHKFVNWAVPLAKKAPAHVSVAHFIGMLGYYSGPGNIFVDELGLADPLLARLPVSKDDGGFLVGHFKRTVPVGYVDAIKTGSTDEMDPSLAKYYEKLHVITSGDLLDPERLKTIIAFNLGTYDHWKQAYLYCNVW